MIRANIGDIRPTADIDIIYMRGKAANIAESRWRQT